MQQKTINSIAEELKTKIYNREYKNFGDVPYIFNTALVFETIDENGRPIIVSDPTQFPSSCKKSTITDHISANMPNLGKIRKINWQHFNDEMFTVADIETTGLSPDYGAKIIEIGAVKINKDGEVIEEFSSFINPLMKLPAKTRELTGITQADVDNAPYLSEVLTKFWEFLRGTTVVFHNSPFDWERFLIPNFKKVGIVVPDIYPCIDTLYIYKEMHPEVKKHGLEELCELYGVEVENHHRAINDAQMTAKAFAKMRKQYQDKFENLPKTRWVKAKKEIPEIQVKRVSFWGLYKKKSGAPMKERQYVDFVVNGHKCSAYFEILENNWVIQNCPVTFDINYLQDAVLKFLDLKTLQELRMFRN